MKTAGMKAKGVDWGGVYVFRGNRQGLLGRLPLTLYLSFVLPGALLCSHHFLHHWWLGGASLLLSPRQTLYVGEGRVRSRRRDHLEGSVKYNALPKPWSDLDPSWYFLPLPYVKPLIRSVETLVILLLWPVYNHQKNLWNPRRIPLSTAKRQRGQRDFAGWSFNFRYGHAILWVAGIGFAWMNGWLS